jgi:TPR repeat protein
MSEAHREEAHSRRSLDAARIGAALREDPDAGIAAIRRAAREGDIGAQALFGQILLEGRGGVADAAEGFHWHVVAASAGHVESMNMVGRCHELGRGTAVDEALAAVWYRKAAEAGLDWGLYNYANLLATGRGVARDRAQAFALYRRAAAMGHAKSMNLVGRHYDEGWEVERDPAAAVAWYRRSAEGGDFRGQASYASVLARAGRIGEAEQWLECAIDTGTPLFLERLAQTLADSPHEGFRAIAARIRARLTPPAPAGA